MATKKITINELKRLVERAINENLYEMDGGENQEKIQQVESLLKSIDSHLTAVYSEMYEIHKIISDEGETAFGESLDNIIYHNGFDEIDAELRGPNLMTVLHMTSHQITNSMLPKLNSL